MRAHLPARRVLIGAVVLLLLALGAAKVVSGRDPYTINVLVPAADDTYPGTRVTLAGRPVGEVSAVGVDGDMAKLTLHIDDSAAPLPSGTLARIAWNSVIGRRTIELTAAPRSNPAMPSGKTIRSKTERVELDDIIAALDAPTRAKVQRLVAQLDATLDGNEKAVNTTLSSAGPFVEALGQVLRGVGQDGPAIKALVTRLRQVTDVLAQRHSDVSATVANLTALTTEAARQQQQLATALDTVPSTLRAGTAFFGKVPAAVDKALPLVQRLRPATDQLPAVAAKLNPVLTDLSPTVAELRPTLAAASELLGETPGLLDSTSATLPDVTTALATLQPAVSFLRPYTPEVVGFLTNWASLFSAKNNQGHFGRALVPAGAASFNGYPLDLTNVIPGMLQTREPAPGSLAGQPWTDANGDAIR